jgi:Ser/Thr protein kinase RdoA (MazF antagonist)
VEEKRAGLANLPRELRLSDRDVQEIRAIGDNAGCMALKGASPEHTGETRPDRWNLDEHLETVARRWGIEPESDLVKLPQGAPA